jgi:hypothetical protein
LPYRANSLSTIAKQLSDGDANRALDRKSPAEGLCYVLRADYPTEAIAFSKGVRRSQFVHWRGGSEVKSADFSKTAKITIESLGPRKYGARCIQQGELLSFVEKRQKDCQFIH